MKRLVLAAIRALVVFLAVGAWFVLRPSDAVTVTVLNRSHLRLTSIRISHEDGVVRAGSLAIGAATTLRFTPHGESSYQLTVNLADGHQLRSGGGYVEPGYRFTETVTDQRITSEMKDLG